MSRLRFGIFTAPFHLDGFQARSLHTDTCWMPPAQHKSAPPKARVGDVTRAKTACSSNMKTGNGPRSTSQAADRAAGAGGQG